MKVLKPIATADIARRPFFGWKSKGDDPALTFDLTTCRAPFVCFFVKAAPVIAGPKMVFDHGEGFNELTAIVLRPFPFGFYHFSLATQKGARKLRLRPCQGEGRLRLVVFETKQSLLVAVLHYLFNLRYQNIGLVVADAKGNASLWETVRANVARIRKFFGDVSGGSGVRVQQADDDLLARLCLAQSLQVRPLQATMRETLGAPEVPLLSIVSPIYDTPAPILRDLLSSFAAEEAPYCELVLSDDGSTKAETLAELEKARDIPGVRVLTGAPNGGIAVATNRGIAAARGTWVTFIDHDDALATGALARIAAAIRDNPEAVFFYTDEVVANAALKPIGSFCKPAYDPVLLSGQNYINHFSVFRRDRLNALGGLRLDREGSQDYDLLLRYLVGAKPGQVVHVPFLAYVWRRSEGSYSTVFRDRSVDNARLALRAAFGVAAVDPATNPDLHRVRFARGKPLVSIVIPNRDSRALIGRLVEDLRKRTDYADIEIVVVDNGSTDAAVLDFYAAQAGERFRAEVRPSPFNFARMCNLGAALAKGSAILFLNNDVEVIEPGWLDEMVECLAYPQAGIVGAKLLYPSGRIQHAGVITGLGDYAGHWYVEDAADEPGPMGRLAVRQTVGAVTAACMLVTRDCFEKLGGFDEETFAVAYNDVDLCLRAKAAGFRTIWTPFAVLTHHESVSRGSDEAGDNKTRFDAEKARLQARHHTATLIDDAFSPFYDRHYSRPHLILPPTLPDDRLNALG